MLELAVRARRNGFVLDAAARFDGPGVIALFGRSGAGKTTLVEVLAGLLKPHEGLLRVGDETLLDTARGIDVPAERRRCGYVFQDARLFPHLDVRGNLRYGLKRARLAQPNISYDEIVELLGLTALIGRRPHQLSGGERQRVAIGRALLAQPRLLLLDEPLASIDAARRDEVLPYLEKLRAGFAIPIVYVSHQFDEVLRLATHVVLLEHGKVLTSGDLASVSTHPALRSIVGADAVGTVLEGEISGVEPETGLTLVRLGAGTLRIAAGIAAGSRVRVRVLARDLILARDEPRGLSVRNSLAATVLAIEPDGRHTDLVHLDIGGPRIAARITHAATQDLSLAPGLVLRVLVKSVSLSGQSLLSRQESP